MNNVKIRKTLCVFFIFMTVPLLSLSSHAHKSASRYVAGSGVDTGHCDTPATACRTIQYALNFGGKGDHILIAQGQYEITNSDIFYQLASALPRLQGGFNVNAQFTQNDPTTYLSTIIGVPPEFRERFEQAGFRVIVDIKAIGKKEQEKISSLSKKLISQRTSRKKTACNNNMAASFSCSNIDLQQQLSVDELMPTSTLTSDIWGFVDLNTLREYVIIGVQYGASVVDITDPSNAVVIGHHKGLASNWRDIKVYQHYNEEQGTWEAFAYVTTEAEMGLAILDLSELPNRISTRDISSDFSTAHNVYLANVDYTFGFSHGEIEPIMTIAGANTQGGKYRLYSLQDPGSPKFLNVTGNGYMHDAASKRINDSRKTEQCKNADAKETCLVLADFNETTVDIWDITQPDNAQRLSTFNYDLADYVHSGWWSEDGMYLFVHDEFDEINGANTRLRIFDMSKLHAPKLSGIWQGENGAIDHNGFVKGNRYYMSTYTQGLTVLDLSDPESPETIGVFDTESTTNSTTFSGAWGVYPFFPSHTIAVSDISSGLFLLQDNTRASASGQFIFSQMQYTSEEGSPIILEIQRINGAKGEASVDLSLSFLTAHSDDIEPTLQQRLTWGDGETASKTVTINPVNDGQDEAIEHLMAKLVNIQGNATLGYPFISHLYISDANRTTEIELSRSSITVNHQLGKVYVPVKRQASAKGNASVSYRTHSDSLTRVFNPSSGTLTWEDGEVGTKLITLPLTSANENTNESANIEIYSPIGSDIKEGKSRTTLVFGQGNEGTGNGSTDEPPTKPDNKKRSGGGSMPINYLLLLCLLVFIHIRLDVKTKTMLL